MYKMVNKFGNAIRYAKTKEKRDALIELGYHEEKEEAEKIDLEKMKVEELEKYAAEKGIDLTGCNNKAEKIAKIRESITD